MKTKLTFRFSEWINILLTSSIIINQGQEGRGILGKINTDYQHWMQLGCDNSLFDNLIEIEFDSETGYPSIDEAKQILQELKNYINKTPVSHEGKFYRMKMFSELHRAILLFSTPDKNKRGWHKPARINSFDDLLK